jgi:hypothetical protein
MRHVISLTTIPPRFGLIGPTLRSLLAQRLRPEAIELWIPRAYRRFPQWGGALPDLPEGVTLMRTETDLGPATKILPAARAYRGQEIDLVYLDDDHIYGRDWTRTALDLRRAHPAAVICGAGLSITRYYGYVHAEEPKPRAVPAPRAMLQPRFTLRWLMRTAGFGPDLERAYRLSYRRFDRSGYIDVAEGFGGVVVRPGFLDDAAFDIPPVVWAVDDIWLSGTYTRLGVPIWADRSLDDVRENRAPSAGAYPLGKAVLEGANRHQANRACIEHMRAAYGIWGGAARHNA